jgi:YqaJ-like viral recombinase domain
MNDEAELVQGSPEWRQARCGSIGSSEVPDLMRRVKSGGFSASRANLMACKVVERLTKVPFDGFKSRAMLQGLEREPLARAEYAFMHDCPVKLIGLAPHPTIAGAHASPDGLVGDVGLVSIKCPEPAQHMATLLGEPISADYLIEMHWQMICAGRAWCDFVSFNPDFPLQMRLFVQRVRASDEVRDELERAVSVFIAELEAKLASLAAAYGFSEAA